MTKIVLRLLWKQLITGEKCACVLLENLHISQPTLSHHMKILCSSGIVVYAERAEMGAIFHIREGVALAIEYLRSFMTIRVQVKIIML